MRKEIQNNSEILNANISSKQPSSNVNSQSDGWIYIGHFPDPLQKAEQNMSEAEKIMKKYFVEEDSKKKLGSFIGLAFKSRLTSICVQVFSPELTTYYTFVDEFCLEDFTKLWPGDLAFLEEFECVIADILLDGIISGDIELPEFLLVVKVLMLDTTVKNFLCHDS